MVFYLRVCRHELFSLSVTCGQFCKNRPLFEKKKAPDKNAGDSRIRAKIS